MVPNSEETDSIIIWITDESTKLWKEKEELFLISLEKRGKDSFNFK
jgi:hypothetical protein